MLTHTQNLARSGGRRDPVLDLRNGSPLASSLKKCHQNELVDSLNNPIKEHLRLLRPLHSPQDAPSAQKQLFPRFGDVVGRTEMGADSSRQVRK